MIRREMSGDGGDTMDFNEIATVRQADRLSPGSFEVDKSVRPMRLTLGQKV